MKRLIHIVITLLAAVCPAAAQTDTAATVVRPVLAAYTLEAGSSHLCDTYLTPLHYSGWQTALGYERMQAMRFDPERWIMRLGGRVQAGRALNPARNAAMWHFDFSLGWDMMFRHRLGNGFTLAGGGTVGARVGALSLMRNSNNPVSARAALTIGITGMAVWNGNLGRLPLTLAYRPTLPLTGVFFAPDYNELYYEIWLGNHSRLVHGAWPGNYFALDNLLTADLHFGTTTLRLGYRLNVASTKANNLVTRDISHSLVIGITGEWISLRARSARTPDAKVISAMY